MNALEVWNQLIFLALDQPSRSSLMERLAMANHRPQVVAMTTSSQKERKKEKAVGKHLKIKQGGLKRIKLKRKF